MINMISGFATKEGTKKFAQNSGVNQANFKDFAKKDGNFAKKEAHLEHREARHVPEHGRGVRAGRRERRVVVIAGHAAIPARGDRVHRAQDGRDRVR